MCSRQRQECKHVPSERTHPRHDEAEGESIMWAVLV